MQKVVDSDRHRDHARYNKPVSVVIDYEDYLAIVEQLEDQHAGRRAAATLEQIRQDPTHVRPFQSLVAELIEEGELEQDAIASANA